MAAQLPQQNVSGPIDDAPLRGYGVDDAGELLFRAGDEAARVVCDHGVLPIHRDP